VLPNFTVFAPVKFVPVIVTGVPPAAGPDAGEMPVTTGIPIYVNLSFAEVGDVPPAVVTVTSTDPVPAGLVAVTDVSVSAVTDAGVLPNFTAVALPRFVPVMVTEVPPAAGPLIGRIPVTAGAAI
jgi:hypothetical protein